MRQRRVGLVLLCLLASSCAKVRDFGCLSGGYWAAAPSHAEMGVYNRQQTAVLERYVDQVGLSKDYIVAVCKVSPGDNVTPLPQEKPCGDFNVINTATEQVWRGLSATEAQALLGKAGVAMPELHSVNEWFNQDWPNGNPSAFCKAHFQASPLPQS